MHTFYRVAMQMSTLILALGKNLVINYFQIAFSYWAQVINFCRSVGKEHFIEPLLCLIRYHVAVELITGLNFRKFGIPDVH